MMRFLFFALLLIAGGLQAQNHGDFPWWNSPLRQDLGLTPQQEQQIRQIVHSYRNRLLDARNTVAKAQGDLEDVLNDPQVNPDEAKQVIDRLAAARANSTRVFLEMSVQLRRVLTYDQWRALIRRWDEQQKRKPPDTQTPP
ncbi:MAG: periplasmic heavy metal sensor [Acidobacteriaceae bacterium]|nr:periplasmic heavy metal sensor [Acidobacteriaceae bacterium]